MELLIVIAIIGVLASTLVPSLINARSAANNTAVKMFIREVAIGVEGVRNPSSGELPISTTTCYTLSNKSLYPSSVDQCKYTPGNNQSYVVVAKGTNGKIFQYDGNEYTELTTYNF
jgi:type II secretory pathway pseudopilin PulG